MRKKQVHNVIIDCEPNKDGVFEPVGVVEIQETPKHIQSEVPVVVQQEQDIANPLEDILVGFGFVHKTLKKSGLI